MRAPRIPTGIKDKGIAEIKLKFVAPEEVLAIARPLLGLEQGKDVGPDISIAVDPTGDADLRHRHARKIQILQDLVEKVDVKREAATDAVALEQPQLHDPSSRIRRSAGSVGRAADAPGRPARCPHVA